MECRQVVVPESEVLEALSQLVWLYEKVRDDHHERALPNRFGQFVQDRHKSGPPGRLRLLKLVEDVPEVSGVPACRDAGDDRVRNARQPDGVALLHTIGRYSAGGGSDPWIRKYIFPGGYIPALSDEVIMVRDNARIHLGGPSIVKVAINEEVDGETLGGAEMHTRVSGVSDHLAEDEYHALALMRDIVANLGLKRPMAPDAPAAAPLNDPKELLGVISADRKQPYDVRELLLRMIDAGEFREFKPNWGETLVCGTARIHGYRVGILGNNGALLSDSSLKGAQFVSMCDQRSIPLLFLHNISGFMVGTEAERGGIAKDSAKLVYAMSVAKVPRLSVIVGGSYGAGNYGMCGRGFAPRFLFAWPTAELATMSADIASNVMLELRRAKGGDPAKVQADLERIEAEVRAQYAKQSDPYYATSRLWDDGLIEPGQTRDILGLCLAIVTSVPDSGRHTPVFRM